MTTSSSHLIPPHGGELVDLIAQPEAVNELKSRSREWPSWDLSARQLCDLELLLGGGFSPLRGFMTRQQAAGLADLPEAAFQAALEAVQQVNALVPSVFSAPRPALPADFALSVLMPVYNERDTIR